MTERVRHYACASLVTVAGTAAVFSVLIAINNPPAGPKKGGVEHQTTFKVEKAAEPKQVQRKVVRTKQPQRAPAAPAPPALANLDSAIGSVDVPLPGFDLSGLNRLDGSLGADKNLVMTDETADEAPKAVSQTSMTYPIEAKAEGVQGYVTLSVLISASGGIEDVKVLDSKPSGVFDQAAIEGIRQWKFTPATYRGKPVTVWARQTIRFDLG